MQNAECKVQNEVRWDTVAEIWDLLKSIFWILAGMGIFVVAYLFSGGMFNNGICAFLAYVAIFCILH